MTKNHYNIYLFELKWQLSLVDDNLIQKVLSKAMIALACPTGQPRGPIPRDDEKKINLPVNAVLAADE